MVWGKAGGTHKQTVDPVFLGWPVARGPGAVRLTACRPFFDQRHPASSQKKDHRNLPDPASSPPKRLVKFVHQASLSRPGEASLRLLGWLGVSSTAAAASGPGHLKSGGPVGHRGLAGADRRRHDRPGRLPRTPGGHQGSRGWRVRVDGGGVGGTENTPDRYTACLGGEWEWPLLKGKLML